MPIRIHHVHIRTRDLEASIAFYKDVIGLELGHRPDFGSPGAWLYDRDVPAVHLNLVCEETSAGGTAFDHVAFFVDDLTAALHRLTPLAVPYFDLRFMPDGELRQCFLKDPNGITIELQGR